MSRLQQVRDAVRPEMKARLLLAGPPGAGKTRTALVIAAALAGDGKPLVIDSEEESALTYADDFRFKHLAWAPPFDPRELTDTLIEVGTEFPVVVIDSLTHWWRDEGGTLDIAGGKFTGWKAARPAQRDLIKAILRLPVHVVLCVRSKVEYTQVERNGRQTVEKLGMAHEQDDSLEYEVNVSAELDMEHRLTIAKTRCPVLGDRQFPPGERHAAEMAKLYADWLRGGEPVASHEMVTALTARMNAMPEGRRRECKQAFADAFGRPDYLRAAQVDDALALVTRFELEPDPDPPSVQPVPDDASDGVAPDDAEDPAPQEPDGTEAAGDAPAAASVPKADDWDRQALRARIDEIPDEFRDELKGRWKHAGLPALPHLAESHVGQVIELLAAVQDTAKQTFDLRRKRANAAMSSAGVKGDDRHPFMRDALGLEAAAEVSTSHLTQEQTDMIASAAADLKRSIQAAADEAQAVAS